jgi:hypothetical protein
MHNKAVSIRNGIRCNGICLLVNNFKIYYTKTSPGADQQVKKCHAHENKKLKKIKMERISVFCCSYGYFSCVRIHMQFYYVIVYNKVQSIFIVLYIQHSKQ